MNTRKILGLALWLLAFTVPFWYSMLNTDTVVYEDGSANNTKGLISFVAMVILVFAGYMLVDSSRSTAAGSESGHH